MLKQIIKLVTINITAIFILVFTNTNANAQTKITAMNHLAQERCNRITERVQNRLKNYDENKEKYIEKYIEIKARLKNLIAKLDSKGYDTSKLKTDIQALDNMIKDFELYYSNFVNALTKSKEYACGNSEGQFKEQIENARMELKRAREQAFEIRKFVRETIKSDLVELKNQAPKN